MEPGLFLALGSAPASRSIDGRRAGRVRRPGAAAWRRSCFRVHVRARVKQTPDRLDLPLRLPRRSADVSIGGIMQWRAVAVILRCVRIRPRRQQHADDFISMPRRRQMQRRIADIEPVRDRRVVEPGLALR